jgi:hypothetical protein
LIWITHLILTIHSILPVHASSTEASALATHELAPLTLAPHKALARPAHGALAALTRPAKATAWSAALSFSSFAALFHKLAHLRLFRVAELTIMVCVKTLSHPLHKLFAPLSTRPTGSLSALPFTHHALTHPASHAPTEWTLPLARTLKLSLTRRWQLSWCFLSTPWWLELTTWFTLGDGRQVRDYS